MNFEAPIFPDAKEHVENIAEAVSPPSNLPDVPKVSELPKISEIPKAPIESLAAPTPTTHAPAIPTGSQVNNGAGAEKVAGIVLVSSSAS